MLASSDTCYSKGRKNNKCSHKKCVFKRKRNKYILEFLLCTGMRVAELSNLKVMALSQRNSSGIITKGKGGKSRKFYISK